MRVGNELKLLSGHGEIKVPKQTGINRLPADEFVRIHYMINSGGYHVII